jgi:RNA polymerase sigma factor for flagellar operon FliA
LQGVGLVSASTRANDDEDQPAPDYPAKPETHPDSMCGREELRTALNTAMQTLPVRYKKVVVMYYRKMTMKQIGGMLGVNESRVSQIHASALEKMANVLQSSGINSSAAFAVAQ